MSRAQNLVTQAIWVYYLMPNVEVADAGVSVVVGKILPEMKEFFNDAIPSY